MQSSVNKILFMINKIALILFLYYLYGYNFAYLNSNILPNLLRPATYLQIPGSPVSLIPVNPYFIFIFLVLGSILSLISILIQYKILKIQEKFTIFFSSAEILFLIFILFFVKIIIPFE